MSGDRNPYVAPRQEPPAGDDTAHQKRWTLIRLLGICLAIGAPLVGLIGTIVSMTWYVRLVDGDADVNPELTNHLAIANWSTILTMPLMVAGIVIAVVATLKLKAMRGEA